MTGKIVQWASTLVLVGALAGCEMKAEQAEEASEEAAEVAEVHAEAAEDAAEEAEAAEQAPAGEGEAEPSKDTAPSE